MSYSYMLVRLKDKINNFKEFHDENVIDVETSLEDIKSIIYEIVPGIEWSQKDELFWRLAMRTLFGIVK
jgi:hypothetical protein